MATGCFKHGYKKANYRTTGRKKKKDAIAKD